MATDGSNINFRDPEALMAYLGTNAVDGPTMTARMNNDGNGNPPPPLSTGQAPVDVPNPGIAVSPDQSMIIPAVTGAYPAADLPPLRSDYSSVIGLDTTEPADPQQSLASNNQLAALPKLEPKMPWDESS